MEKKTITIHASHDTPIDVEIIFKNGTWSAEAVLLSTDEAKDLHTHLSALFPTEPTEAIHNACLHNYNEKSLHLSDIVDYAYKLGQSGKQPVFNEDENIWE